MKTHVKFLMPPCSVLTSLRRVSWIHLTETIIFWLLNTKPLYILLYGKLPMDTVLMLLYIGKYLFGCALPVLADGIREKMMHERLCCTPGSAFMAKWIINMVEQYVARQCADMQLAFLNADRAKKDERKLLTPTFP